MKNILALTAIAAMIAGTAQAVPTLTLSDNNGNSVTITDNDVNDLSTTAGSIVFKGALGNWTFNVTTGLASPPGNDLHGTASQPAMDLNTVSTFNQTSGPLAGNVLTITFVNDNLGPINGTVFDHTGGSNIGTTDNFTVLVNGSPISTQTLTATAFAGDQGGQVVTGGQATVGIQAVLTASSLTADTSFDSRLTVPDSGMTLAMLGAGLAGLVVFARTRKTA